MSEEIDEYLENHRKQYQEYLNFLKIENAKEPGISKEIQRLLYKEFKNIKHQNLSLEIGRSYSSGRKVKPLDENSVFVSVKLSDTSMEIRPIYFCKEEIESYAKSYRIFRPETENLFGMKDNFLVQVFEFKPEKI